MMNTKKAAGGRPELPPDERQGVRVSLRLRPADAALVKRAADIGGDDLSTWIRRAAVKAAKMEAGGYTVGKAGA